METSPYPSLRSRARLLLASVFVATGLFVATSEAFGSFESPVQFAVGAGPEFVATGDLNGDGKTDLATANKTESKVSILLGNGLGSFSDAPGSPFPAGGNPSSVAIGNLNADSVPDLVVTNPFSNTVSILLGAGDGSFGSPTAIPTGGTQPQTVVIGNFNTDTNADLAVTNPHSSSVNVSILLGDGTGSFNPAPGSPYPVSSKPSFTPSSPFGIAIGNFNGGRPDLVVGSQATSIYVMFGNADGSFSTTADSTYLMGEELPPPEPQAVPQSVAVGNLNGDAFDDVVSANRDQNSISVRLGNGDGTFGPNTQFAVGTKPVSIAIGNLNGGSIPDLAVANADLRLAPDGSDSVSVLLGTGDGTFGAATSLPFSSGSADPLSIAIANLNADTLPDLVTTDANNVSIRLGTTAPTATLSPGRLDFEPRDPATTSPAQTLTFTNTSESDQVEVGAITIIGGQATDFAISSETCSAGPLLPTETCEVNVTFTPDGPGQRFAEIQVAFNGASSPLSVDLAGVGIEPPVCPELTIGTPPDCVELKARIGKVTVTGPSTLRKGKPTTYRAKITNSGNAKATGVRLVVSGRGIRFNTPVGTINSGATRTVNLRLRPSRTGRIKATFKVTSSNAGSRTVRKTVRVR